MPFCVRSTARLAVSLVLAAVSASGQAALHLIPMPREVTARGDQPIRGVEVLCVGCDAEDNFAAEDLRQTLAARGIPSTGGTGLRILLKRSGTGFTAPMQAEGYTIVSADGSLTLTGATAAGVFYAAQTAKQLISLDGTGHPVLHAADIRDWPAMRYRGLSDDLSRGPVDMLEFQKKLIRTLAAYKDNVYSPYFEHTQQYASNPLPAPPGGSISPAEARELTAYALQFHITVIPEQEAFGHLHHNLLNEQYADLSETPHGAVLAPGQPGSLQVITQEFGELAADYPGPFLHIGADETVDLGTGRTRAAVDSQGLAPVYLDFLQKIDTALFPLHRKLLFWGDIAQDSPGLLKAMPASFKANTIAVAWWYNPRPAGFAKYIRPFTEAGFETWVAPGINNWSRVYPNYNTGLLNIQEFTHDGQAEGAVGQLNTIWYDDGEALASNNWYGILFGAAAAWQPGTSSIPAFQASYGAVFHGDLTGKLNQAQEEIMAAHDVLKLQAKAGDGSDGLFWLDPWSRDGLNYAAKLRPYNHDLRLHAEKAMQLIAEARAAYPCNILYEQMSRAKQTTTFCSGEIHSESGVNIASAPATSEPSAWNPTSLREPDAIDALELGARRLDFIGLKFQLADEMAAAYARAEADSTSSDKKTRALTSRDLGEIRSINGKLEDIVDEYSLIRDLYSDLWLQSNRRYALRPVQELYDYTIGTWYARIDRLRSVQRQWDDSKTLPTAAQLGIPAPSGPGATPPPPAGTASPE